MPLHRKHPTVDGLERLDQTIGRVTCRHQPGAQCGDGLVVRRSDDYLIGVVCGMNSTARRQGNRVSAEQFVGRRTPVRDVARHQVDVEVPAPQHVQDLRTATDAEHR